MVGDVRRRAHELSGARAIGWLIRLGASLLANAAAAWVGRSRPGMRQASHGFSRWRGWGSGFSWLDLKLGLRMLLKHPALTLVGGLGIAVAIGACAGFFAFAYGMFYPTIPLDEGHRLVGLENWDLERNNEERRSLHDFVVWRDEMSSVEDMSAFRDVSRNLNAGEGSVGLVRLAEMTPSGFDLARVPPFLGRTLTAADAERDAPDVLVIGYDVWRTRFVADPNVVGKTVRLGRVVHTIVGVMPEGFAFPMNHHYWIPFKQDPADYPVGEGPSIFISGRLAPEFTLEDAQTELTVIGSRMAAEFPDTHARFRPQVMPYIYPLVDINENGAKGHFWAFTAMNAFISLLLVLVGLNVGVLIYARTAARRGEIAVRTALGASRGRVVGQLFAESLVLAVGSAAVGLLLARVGVGLGNQILAMEVAEIPFWMNLGFSGPAVAYVVVLTILVAVLTGVVPGLQATGKKVQANIQQYRSGVGLRLGFTWTTLIVVQVAVTVAGLPLAVGMGWGEVSYATTRPAYDVGRFLGIFLATDEEGLTDEEVAEYRQGHLQHMTSVRSELIRRLEAEPGIEAYTPAVDLPGRGPRVRVVLAAEVDRPGSADSYEASSSRVHSDFFPTFEIPILTGRPILPEDLEEAAEDVVVVDRTFVRRILGGGEALGRRLRFLTAGSDTRNEAGTERWYRIVGVVENLHENFVDESLVEPHVYRPLREAQGPSAIFVLRVSGIEPTSLVGRVREIASELDPTMRVRANPLTRYYRQDQLALMLAALVLALIAASVLLLSAAGIYALMSFTISQRRREIGIRTALGAQRRWLLAEIFRRALVQLGSGVVLGVAVALALDWGAEGEALHGHGGALLTGMVIIMTAVGLLAALGPARRGLRIQPTEALSAE